ncbi:MAG: helix-turn-helix transcriptional regulator [Cenarchaeum sp. SB0669_bin_11]|nr:helix-turn-helix transcriptional regulator [Cenarchaeum sp. SB0669_bin_11]
MSWPDILASPMPMKMSNWTGQDLKAWRAERGLSRSQLARIIGRSLTTTRRYERGGRPIPLNVVAMLRGRDYEAEEFGAALAYPKTPKTLTHLRLVKG